MSEKWYVDDTGYQVRDIKTNLIVAVCAEAHIGKEQCLANAKRIANIPQLEEALADLIKTCESDDVQEYGERPSRSAIVQAKEALESET